MKFLHNPAHVFCTINAFFLHPPTNFGVICCFFAHPVRWHFNMAAINNNEKVNNNHWQSIAKSINCKYRLWYLAIIPVQAWIFSIFNIATALVVCITATINHVSSYLSPQFKIIYMIFHIFMITCNKFCLITEFP